MVPFNKNSINSIVSAWLNGLSIEQISFTLGVRPSVVKVILKKYKRY